MEMDFFLENAPRRRRAQRMETRQQKAIKQHELITIEESEDENESPRDWRCSSCPVILETATVRVLVPCGHVYCDDCADGLATTCPKCKQAIQQKLHPALHESDPLDLETETKRIEIESARLREEIQRLNMECEKLEIESEKEKKELTGSIDYYKVLVHSLEKEQRDLHKQNEESRVEQTIVNCLSRIENRSSFPFDKSVAKISSILFVASIHAHKKFRELRTDSKHELDSTIQELRKATSEAELFDKVEFRLREKNGRSDESTISDDSGCPPTTRRCLLDDEDFEN